MNTLSDLFPKTRAEILRLLFAGGNQEIHLRTLARLAGLSPAALQKELTSLAAKELVLTRRDGNRLYYRANTSHPLFPELCGIVLKTSGIWKPAASNATPPNTTPPAPSAVPRRTNSAPSPGNSGLM